MGEARRLHLAVGLLRGQVPKRDFGEGEYEDQAADEKRRFSPHGLGFSGSRIEVPLSRDAARLPRLRGNALRIARGAIPAPPGFIPFGVCAGGARGLDGADTDR